MWRVCVCLRSSVVLCTPSLQKAQKRIIHLAFRHSPLSLALVDVVDVALLYYVLLGPVLNSLSSSFSPFHVCVWLCVCSNSSTAQPFFSLRRQDSPFTVNHWLLLLPFFPLLTHCCSSATGDLLCSSWFASPQFRPAFHTHTLSLLTSSPNCNMRGWISHTHTPSPPLKLSRLKLARTYYVRVCVCVHKPMRVCVAMLLVQLRPRPLLGADVVVVVRALCSAAAAR